MKQGIDAMHLKVDPKINVGTSLACHKKDQGSYTLSGKTSCGISAAISDLDLSVAVLHVCAPVKFQSDIIISIHNKLCYRLVNRGPR